LSYCLDKMHELPFSNETTDLKKTLDRACLEESAGKLKVKTSIVNKTQVES